jgi:hypothetical protein
MNNEPLTELAMDSQSFSSNVNSLLSIQRYKKKGQRDWEEVQVLSTCSRITAFLLETLCVAKFPFKKASSLLQSLSAVQS